MWKEIKNGAIQLVTSRLFLLVLVFFGLFSILVHRLFVLQIVQGEEHLQNFEYKSLKNLDIKSARGNIYDVNGKLLAYNRIAYQVTYDSSTNFSKRVSEKYGKVTNDNINKEKNQVFYELIKLLQKNGDSIIDEFPITLDENNKCKFSVESESVIKRFKQDVFGFSSSKNLKPHEEKMMEFSAEEMFEYLRHGTGSSSANYKNYDISEEYSKEDALKIMTIRYNINLNAYSQYKMTTIAMDISKKSLATIKENPEVFYGIDVVADSLREYNYGKYFSHIIGYTGTISEEQVDELNKGKADDDRSRYDNNDIVGKAGIEQSMEGYLQGVKGHREVFVNNLGQILEETNRIEPKAGNDLYLTIDAELQKRSYDILEKNLANILCDHLTPSVTNGNTNSEVSIYQVYYALIDNNVVDHTKFSSKFASKNEQNIYKTMVKNKPKVISELKKKLKNDTTANRDLSNENKEYMNFIYSLLINNKILLKNSIDQTDSITLSYNEGKISLGKFLNYAIKKSWIDSSVLDITSDFYDLDTIYNELLRYIGEELEGNQDFEKILYKYLIQKGVIKGNEICLVLYDQNVLNKKKDKDYDALKRGELGGYSFMKRKIQNLEITPAQLALDPYSGTIIITDVKTGKVKTVVSYPSYDINKMANQVDSAYFKKINTDKSSPMLFRATQSRSAPGSTFKPLMAIAGIEEGVIGPDSGIVCNHTFEKIVPSPTCMGYHGVETTRTGLRDSCNVFFYEVGYRLGSKNGKFSNEKGLEVLKKYATMFGLNEPSGMEVHEYDPQVSTSDIVRSSIGQGTNNYTPSQLARYVTAIANRGTTFNLSILDKVVGQEENIVEKFEPKILHKLNIKKSTWDAVQEGMFLVVNSGHSPSMTQNFKNLGVLVSGKTGTAQEDKKRADHALFVSYGPSNKPEISVTVVVQNGYSSAFIAPIASQVYDFYFNKDHKNEK